MVFMHETVLLKLHRLAELSTLFEFQNPNYERRLSGQIRKRDDLIILQLVGRMMRNRAGKQTESKNNPEKSGQIRGWVLIFF